VGVISMRVLGLWVGLFMLVLPAHAEVRDPYGHFFDPKMGDLQSDLQAARQEGKAGILLMFEYDDCPFCLRMKNTVLNQSEVQDFYRKHFVSFPIDVKGDTALVDFQGRQTTEKLFALEQRARATPVFVFYDGAGQTVARYTGATKDVAEFMLLGRYVVEGKYREMPFAVYKRQAR